MFDVFSAYFSHNVWYDIILGIVVWVYILLTKPESVLSFSFQLGSTVIVVAIIGAVVILVIVAIATVLIIWKCLKSVSVFCVLFLWISFIEQERNISF